VCAGWFDRLARDVAERGEMAERLLRGDGNAHFGSSRGSRRDGGRVNIGSGIQKRNEILSSLVSA
jgi:hypothetical protein